MISLHPRRPTTHQNQSKLISFAQVSEYVTRQRQLLNEQEERQNMEGNEVTFEDESVRFEQFPYP